MTMLGLSGIHFLVTYQCLFRCDHCFVWGGPDQYGTMTLAQLRDVIDQAVALGGIDTVYFEGGEPTLVHPVVVSAARHARERGLDIGLVTNSEFAESVEDAVVWLAPFAELGISDLSLSTYPYFTEVSEPRLLRNAVEAALRLGLGDALGVLEVGAAADLADLGVACGDPGDIMYKGRAARVLAPEHAARPPDTLISCPHEDFVEPGRCHVGCDGELQICQGVSAGNVFAGSLAQVVADYDPERRPVVRDLRLGGPWRLSRGTGLEPERELYADECHFCYELRSRLRGRYPEVLAPGQCYGVGLPELERPVEPTVRGEA
jgi:hypothetical protein